MQTTQAWGREARQNVPLVVCNSLDRRAVVLSAASSRFMILKVKPEERAELARNDIVVSFEGDTWSDVTGPGADALMLLRSLQGEVGKNGTRLLFCSPGNSEREDFLRGMTDLVGEFHADVEKALEQLAAKRQFENKMLD